MNENVWISIKISLKFPKGPINNIPSLVQIMAWRRPGDKPLSEPMMARLPTHICVTRPQWVNSEELVQRYLNWTGGYLSQFQAILRTMSLINHIWYQNFKTNRCPGFPTFIESLSLPCPLSFYLRKRPMGDAIIYIRISPWVDLIALWQPLRPYCCQP